jgi:hypothetical protein
MELLFSRSFQGKLLITFMLKPELSYNEIVSNINNHFWFKNRANPATTIRSEVICHITSESQSQREIAASLWEFHHDLRGTLDWEKQLQFKQVSHHKLDAALWKNVGVVKRRQSLRRWRQNRWWGHCRSWSCFLSRWSLTSWFRMLFKFKEKISRFGSIESKSSAGGHSFKVKSWGWVLPCLWN